MKFHEFGDKNLPSILLIHGGGSSWWNYLRQARILSKDYRVILPTLNGHGEEYQLDYISTEDSCFGDLRLCQSKLWLGRCLRLVAFHLVVKLPWSFCL